MRKKLKGSHFYPNEVHTRIQLYNPTNYKSASYAIIIIIIINGDYDLQAINGIQNSTVQVMSKDQILMIKTYCRI